MFKILVNAVIDNEPGALEYQWRKGDEKPMPDEAPFWLQATGAEFLFIHARFANIPIVVDPRVNQCQWKGEMAEFIFDNL